MNSISNSYIATSDQGSKVHIYGYFDPKNYMVCINFINIHRMDMVSFPDGIPDCESFPTTTDFFDKLIDRLHRDGWVVKPN